MTAMAVVAVSFMAALLVIFLFGYTDDGFAWLSGDRKRKEKHDYYAEAAAQVHREKLCKLWKEAQAYEDSLLGSGDDLERIAAIAATKKAEADYWGAF